jgi:hypothetical protein
MFWMALIVPLLLQAPPQDDLRKEVDQLKKQNLDLQERLSLLEQAALENAQTIQRLRQMVKLLETNPTPPPPARPSKESGGPAIKPELGPKAPSGRSSSSSTRRRTSSPSTWARRRRSRSASSSRSTVNVRERRRAA